VYLDNYPCTSIAALIWKTIGKLPAKKAMGTDGIPSLVIKRCTLLVVPCLAIITDRCMSDSEYPAIMIVPGPKVRGSTKDADNRSISPPPLFSKIVEQSIKYAIWI
jgi:hypothetical protein